MLAKSSLKDASSGDRRTNVVLGGLTAALVSWLKIPNEVRFLTEILDDL